MKRIFMLLWFISALAGATNYYVKNGGNDGAAGTSDGTAWETITKVNSFWSAGSFAPGDTIFFNKGDEWRGSIYVLEPGTSGSHITIASYGTGAKPLIMGSKEENSTGDWIDQTGNIWKNTDASFSVGVGNLIFNGEALIGHKEGTLGEVGVQGEWFWNEGEKAVYLYSVGNPATFYSDIECALNTNEGVIYLSSRDYITIDSLDLRYGGVHGVRGTSNNDIIVRNCDISYMGGAESGGASLRYGNGIEIYRSSENILFERNKIDNCYDAGITTQYQENEDPYTCSGSIRFNLISNCEYGYELFQRSINSIVGPLYIQNNTFANSGHGWSHDQRPDEVQGHDIRLAGLTGTVVGVYIRNNIFYNSADECIYTYDNLSQYTIDYNLYYPNGQPYGSILTTDYNTLAAWQTAIDNEENAVDGDPVFVTPITDLNLQVTSPAIAEALGAGYIYDYAGNLMNDPPDIGAYAYDADPPPAPPDLPEVITVAATVLWAKGVTSGGSGITDGGGTVSAKGVCYSTSANPTTADAKEPGGIGTDDFVVTIAGLARSTTYYLRAYVTNETGTSYGSNIIITTPATSTFTSGGKYVEGIK